MTYVKPVEAARAGALRSTEVLRMRWALAPDDNSTLPRSHADMVTMVLSSSSPVDFTLKPLTMVAQSHGLHRS